MTEPQEVKYETQIVKCVRGMEARTAAKWESQGWEMVSETTKTLHTEFTLRRPRPKTPWWPFALLGGIVAVLAIMLTVTRLSGGSGSSPQAEMTPSSSVSQAAEPTPSEPAETQSVSPEAVTSTAADESVITTKNNAEFKALLRLGDYCANSVERFAEKYSGRTIAFDASIGAMNNHGNYKTRYNILISAGDFSKTKSRGPAFQLRDVAPTLDLNFTGDVPDTIGVGTNLRVTAEVDKYEASSCLLLLEPVETAVR